MQECPQMAPYGYGGDASCESPSSIVFTAGGHEYAVNGLAFSNGYDDIDPIWATRLWGPGSARSPVKLMGEVQG